MSLHGVPEPDALQEFTELARSAGAEPLALVATQRKVPDSRLYIGSGKAEEVHDLVTLHGADLVIFDNTLSPSQERNLEKIFKCRVLDRTGLISTSSPSARGRMKASCRSSWHSCATSRHAWYADGRTSKRQKGGIGLRGPGETQLETDRRLLSQRIDQIRRRLARVDSRREQGRRSRRRVNEVPTVSLVGYTNAGKSTLFNRLTAAGVYAPRTSCSRRSIRRCAGSICPMVAVILADTVGFVSRLPHELVAIQIDAAGDRRGRISCCT